MNTTAADYDKKKWLVLTVIVIKMIIDGLDGSMLTIALPSISTSLGVTSGAIIWVASAYSITTSTTVLFFGRLGDIIGKTRFYIIGIGIYALSSLFGGMANSLPMLVFARVVQAIGASCTMANSQGIITMVFPPHLRGRALGLYGGAMSIGALAGPTLCGVIVGYMNWQYIFLLKVPIALLAFILGLRYFPKDAPAQKEKMDYASAFIYAVAIIPLLFSLQEGYASGYTSLTILSGLALSVVAFTAFFTMQAKRSMPLLDLGIFKNPLYSINVAAGFILSICTSAFGIIVPFYMQGVLDTPVSLAGLYMSISPVIALLVTPVSGYLSDKVGGEKLVLLGQVINGLALLLMASLKVDTSVLTLVAYISILNFGMALFQAPNNTLIMSSLPREKLGIGGSANMTIQSIGWASGMAFTTALLYGGMSKALGYHVTGYVKGSGQDSAFVYGMRNTFLVSALICALGIVISIVRIIIMRRSLQWQKDKN